MKNKKQKSQSLWQKIENTQVSLITGTLVIATTYLVAINSIPSPDLTNASLLQASVVNIMGIL